MIKRKIGILFSIISLAIIFTQISFNITGNVVSENSINSPYLYLIEVIFLLMSLVLLTTQKTLDAIIIPTGAHNADIRRTRKAIEKRGSLKDEGYFVISGYVPPGEASKHEYRGTQTQNIYGELRSHGIKPSQIRIEPQAQNTIENVVYSLEKIKQYGGRDVGIVSYTGHLDRFQKIIKQAKKEGIIDEDFKIHRIRTNESDKDRLYEIVEKILNAYRLRKGVKEAMKHSQSTLSKFIHNARDYISK